MRSKLETVAEDSGCAEAFAKLRAFGIEEATAELAKPPKSRPGTDAHFGTLYGRSTAMIGLYQMIEKVGPTEASVLLIGESGTGKELVAAAIHRESARGKGSFVAINCGAFSANLIEAELFGYERGAFTGAVRSHRGCFERATGGTLFLDEIAEMPLELQVKLLRALESGCFYRVGGEQEMRVDVRVIAATNRDPNTMVAQGRLREDLLYRLAVFPIPLPPLRARDTDVELLARHFLDELNAEARTAKTFTAAACEYLFRYPWPGNVRELRNAVQRAFILTDREVEFDLSNSSSPNSRPALPAAQSGATLQFNVGMTLEDIEHDVIVATLQHCRGSKREAASILGVSLKTLYNRLNDYRARQAGNGATALGA